MVVVTGNDINHAEKWGGFVSWIGGIKAEEFRLTPLPNAKMAQETS